MREDGQIDSETIFIDCFGGSGLISHNIKQWYPSNRVIWNDYDNYQERLNHIDTTEQIRQEIAKILQAREPQTLKNAKLHPTTKEAILTLLQEQSDAFIDYTTISSYLLFSGNYATTLQELAKQTFFYRTIPQQLQSKGYLAGVERVQANVIELLDSYKDIYKQMPNPRPPIPTNTSGQLCRQLPARAVFRAYRESEQALPIFWQS